MTDPKLGARQSQSYLVHGTHSVFDQVLVHSDAGNRSEVAVLQPGTVLVRIEKAGPVVGMYTDPFDHQAPSASEMVDVVVLDEAIDFSAPKSRKHTWARVLVAGCVKEERLHWDPTAISTPNQRTELMAKAPGIIMRPLPSLRAKDIPPRPGFDPAKLR